MTEKIIMIASSKGGVGKTTASLGIARALCKRGHRVLIADLDFANACLDILTGVQDSVLYTLQDVALKRAKAADALIKLPQAPSSKERKKGRTANKGAVTLLPSALGWDEHIPDELLGESIKDAADAAEADYIILDTGAGTNNGAAAAASIADCALVVTGQMPVAVRAAQATARRLEGLGISDIRLIINSFDAKGVMGGAHRSGLFTVIDDSCIPLGGVIPYDYSLMLSHEGLFSGKSEADQAFDNIASRIEGNNVPIFTEIKRLRKLKKKICL